MFRLTFSAALTGIFFLVSSLSNAQAAVTVGQACTQLGQTQMTDDHAAIAACLQVTPSAAITDCSGGCVWKSMIGTGCPKGFLSVEKSGYPTLGCIQEKENAPNYYAKALEHCYYTYTARLPYSGELYAAARQHNLTFATKTEWVDGTFRYYNGSMRVSGIDKSSGTPLAAAGYSADPDVGATKHGFRCFMP
ncbi:MAG: hypothetical protein WC464_09275 [Bdellovibrionales bacterium]